MALFPRFVIIDSAAKTINTSPSHEKAMEVELDGTGTQQQSSPQLDRCSQRTQSKESPEQTIGPKRDT
jgi:hypothetical protein